MRQMIDKVKNFKQLVNEDKNDKNDKVRLYHRVGFTMNNWFEIIKSVKNEGLVPQGNWEGEEAIWFSSNPSYYAEKGKFVVALDFDISTNGRNNNKYGMVYNKLSGIGTAYRNIPFNRLIVIKIPVIDMNGVKYVSNDIINDINNNKNFTPEILNMKYTPTIIYQNLFNEYVQPFIKIPNYLDMLDKSKIILKNI